MIRTFGQYLLKRPFNALWVIAACSFIPLMSWLASVVVGLMALSKPAKESAMALGVLVLANAIDAYTIYHSGDNLLASLSLANTAFAGGVFLWGIALVLRRHGSWTRVLTATMIIALPILFIFQWYASEIGTTITVWMEQSLTKTLADTRAVMPMGAGLDVSKIGRYFYQQLFASSSAPYFIGGGIIALLYMAGIAQLIVSRWWQARIFPNTLFLQGELLQIRLPISIAAAFLVIAVLFFWTRSPLLLGIAPIILTFWLIASLSLLHGLFSQRKMGWVIIISAYASLILFKNYVLPLLLLIACVDSVVDFRGQFSQVSTMKG